MATPGGGSSQRGYASSDYHRVGWQQHTDNMSDDHELAYQNDHGSPPPNMPVSPSVDNGEHRGADSFSLHSTAPLAPRAVNPAMSMPGAVTMPVPNATEGMPPQGVHFSGAVRPPMPQSSSGSVGKTYHHGNSSWDLLGNLRKLEHEYEEFDTRNASENYLRFAQGDVPNNKVSVSPSLHFSQLILTNDTCSSQNSTTIF